MSERRTVNGITWEKVGDDTWLVEPIWKLVWRGKVRFVLKNYGERDSALSGTMLVSGGPFRGAGRYKSIDEAMHSTQLANYLKHALEAQSIEAAKSLRDLSDDIHKIDKALVDRNLKENQRGSDS